MILWDTSLNAATWETQMDEVRKESIDRQEQKFKQRWAQARKWDSKINSLWKQYWVNKKEFYPLSGQNMMKIEEEMAQIS